MCTYHIDPKQGIPYQSFIQSAMVRMLNISLESIDSRTDTDLDDEHQVRDCVVCWACNSEQCERSRCIRYVNHAPSCSHVHAPNGCAYSIHIYTTICVLVDHRTRVSSGSVAITNRGPDSWKICTLTVQSYQR
jgi:hypothetical protein